MSTTRFTELRKRAQEFLSSAISDHQSLSQADVKKLVEELNTYQVELELQNEDLRQTQLELEQSRSRISDLYDFAPTGYLTVNEKGLIVEANLTVADMLGVERKFLLMQPLSAFIIDDHQDTFYRCRRKLLATYESQTCQLRMRKKNNTIFYAELKCVIKDDFDGESGQFRISITDITSQKKTEDALLRAKTEWELTFDSISDIITLQDQNFTILRANKAACQAFQTKFDKLIGLKCYELFQGSQEPCTNCPAFGTLTSKDCHTAIITHEMLEKTFLVSSSLLPEITGHPPTLVHVAKDITEQLSNEEKLRQAARMQAVGTLAGGIAHEFNNMLMVIMGFTEMALDSVPAGSNVKDDLKEVIKTSLRAKDLVKQILVCSRQSQQQKSPQKITLLIEDSIKLIRAALPSSVDINLSLLDNGATVLVDPTEIQQIMINLCSNASWAIKDAGTITITLDRLTLPEGDISLKGLLSPGSYIKISCADTGCGMSKENQKRIFDPFFTTKEIGQGTGMGLAIVMGIMEGYNGTITVDSDIGVGTTFHLYLPELEKKPTILPEAAD